MPGTLSVSRRQKRSAEFDEEDDVSEGGASQISSGSKRARLDHDAVSEDGDVLPDSYRTEPRRRTNGINGGGTHPGGTYQPGSIVRVKLTNFVTYTSAEFHLGPSLNMVIGPNGTGKSTLVCAICLGLGWGPSHLGRAKELGEFVKHGAREAEIEIELAAGPQQRGRNPIIRRNIKREGNKTTFHINGQATPQKDVLKLARSFSIQIDNLCQFLPQDRVVEFAAQTPVQLLEATQRAAAPEYMVEWHDALKKLRSEQKKKQTEHATSREHLQNLQTRQTQQRADVERMTERKNLVVRQNALERYRPFVQYRVARQTAQEAKERKKEAQLALRQLETEVEPSLRAVNAKQKYQQQIDKLAAQRKRLVDRGEAQADELVRKQNAVLQKIEDCKNEEDAEKAGDKSRKAELARVEQTITRLKRQMDEEPIEFDSRAYNTQIREKTDRLRELETRCSEIKQSMHDIQEQAHPRRQQVAQAQRELQNLKSQSGQQITKLRKLSPDTAKAWEWVQKHQDLFQGRVYGPPIVECSIKDPRYADAVESMLQSNDFLAFTVLSREDFKVLQDHLYGGDMRLADITIRVANHGLEHWRPPVSNEELRNYGLDGWLVDFVSGPEPVLSMLCDSGRLHKTGMTLRDHNNEQYERLVNSPIQSWVTGKQTHNVTRRREYGPKAVSTMVRQTRPARYWTDQPVDLGVERELRASIDGWNDELKELKIENDKLKEELNAAGEEFTNAKQEKKDIEEEKAQRQRAYGEFQALPTKLQAAEDKRKGFEVAGTEHWERLDAIAAKKTKLVLENGQLALDYANAVEMLRKLHKDLFEAEIWGIEAASEVAILTERNLAVKQMLEAKRKEVHDIEREAEQVRETAKRALAEVHRIMEERDEVEENIQNTLAEERPNITTADLEAEIESVIGRIHMLHEGDPATIRQFERRQKDTEKLEEKLAGLESELAKLQTDIDAIREKWEPELDRLVALISEAFAHNFEKIGCAGQVDVHKDDDFDQWSIQIHVRFREHEQLSILDSHRQSGGERAVSTIFYLMALQSLARSPFRVVDEINQGMDPRNERLVHERMVDIACKEHTSQYFLITPKLLHGLKFDPRMKVHCIVSGEYVPDDHKELDFGRLADMALRMKGVA